MIDMMPQSEAEMEAIRNAVISKEGLLLSVFDVLRRVPRRVLMVLKLNDLTRLVQICILLNGILINVPLIGVWITHLLPHTLAWVILPNEPAKITRLRN